MRKHNKLYNFVFCLFCMCVFFVWVYFFVNFLVCLFVFFVKTLLKFVNVSKSVRIRSYSGPYFSAFGLNTEGYSVSLRIQSKCVKIRTWIIPNMDAFRAVSDQKWHGKSSRAWSLRKILSLLKLGQYAPKFFSFSKGLPNRFFWYFQK